MSSNARIVASVSAAAQALARLGTTASDAGEAMRKLREAAPDPVDETPGPLRRPAHPTSPRQRGGR